MYNYKTTTPHTHKNNPGAGMQGSGARVMGAGPGHGLHR